MKNLMPLLLIFIVIFSSCTSSPISVATEYIPMKDEENGVMYAMGLIMTKKTVTIVGIDPRKGGIEQTLTYKLTASNVGEDGVLNYVKRIVDGDSTVSDDIKENIISKTLKFQTKSLGSVLPWNPCTDTPDSSESNSDDDKDDDEFEDDEDKPKPPKPKPNPLSKSFTWRPAWYQFRLDPTIDKETFVPEGLYSKEVLGPNGNNLRVKYEFRGSSLTITQEFVVDEQETIDEKLKN